MTVIAVRNGTIACDSCWNSNGLVNVLAIKVQRLPSGALIGMSGDNDNREVVKLLSNVKSLKGLPTRSELLAIRLDSSGLLLLPNGQIIQFGTSNRLPETVEDDVGAWVVSGINYAAVGSGSEVAMGAFHKGASAVEAVQASCKHNTYCRTPIHHLSLEKTKKVIK